MITFVIGIGIPLGIIFLLNLLRFRIEGHTDVEKLTKVPIIGDIPLPVQTSMKSLPLPYAKTTTTS